MLPITVIIPIYNSERFIKDTIESVLSQTFSNFELLTVDDGSTDQSPEIIKSYNDPRIKYASFPHNFIHTLNQGYDLISSKYIALIDHDDLMMPDRLQVQYEFMESNPDIAACGGYMYSFGNYSYKMTIPLNHEELMFYAISEIPVWNPTGFVRRDFLTAHHIKYQKGYSFSADYKFWIDVLKKGKIANIPKVLTLYRASDNQAHVKYRKQSLKGVQKIRLEMLEYFFSHMKKGDILVDSVENKILPTVIQLAEQDYFSENVFISFMEEIIRGLKQHSLIDV